MSNEVAGNVESLTIVIGITLSCGYLRGCRCYCLGGVGYAALAIGQVALLIPPSFHTAHLPGLIYLCMYY